MAEQAFAAACFYIDEDYEAAVSHYTEAISIEKENAEYYDKRAAAHLALKNFAEANKDASTAISKCGQVPQYYFRKGLALFEQDNFKECSELMRQAKETNSTSGSRKLSSKQLKKADAWLRKCAAEIGEETQTENAPRVKQSSKETVEPTKKTVEAEKGNKKEEVKASSGSSLPTNKSVRHEHYQSFSHVVLSIFARGCAPEDVKVAFGEDYIQVDVSRGGTKEYSKSFFLHSSILPDESEYKIMRPKIEIKLKKASDGVQWPSLEREKGVSEQKISKAYASDRNWEEIDKQLGEEEDDDKPQGEDALNHLFKKIYKDASDETRRAMVKSFQTSGGTVLSTNWDEVSKKDYEKERVAPNGMVWKDNEGNTISK